MIELMPKLVPFKAEDLEVLTKCAAADDHSVIAPTFLVVKDKTIVGYVGSVQSILIWLDTQRCKARDSAMVLNTIENIMVGHGAQIIGMPCVDKSPLRPYLEPLGYTDIKASMFLKNLNPEGR